MRCPIQILLVLTTLAVAGRDCPAGEADAAALSELIDQQIEARLTREDLGPADVADDAEFLRRVYLDLHGVVPTAAQAEQFLKDADPAKRARLIDE